MFSGGFLGSVREGGMELFVMAEILGFVGASFFLGALFGGCLGFIIWAERL